MSDKFAGMFCLGPPSRPRRRASTPAHTLLSRASPLTEPDARRPCRPRSCCEMEGGTPSFTRLLWSGRAKTLDLCLVRSLQHQGYPLYKQARFSSLQNPWEWRGWLTLLSCKNPAWHCLVNTGSRLSPRGENLSRLPHPPPEHAASERLQAVHGPAKWPRSLFLQARMIPRLIHDIRYRTT